MSRPAADDRLRRHRRALGPDRLRAGRHPALGPGHRPEAHGGHPDLDVHLRRPSTAFSRRTTACRSASSRRSRATATAAAARTCRSSPVRTPRSQSVKSILAGEQYSTVFKDTRDLAEVTVDMIKAIAAGREPEVNDTETYDNGVKVVPSYLLDPVLVDARTTSSRPWSTRATTPRTTSSRSAVAWGCPERHPPGHRATVARPPARLRRRKVAMASRSSRCARSPRSSRA